MFLGGWMGGWMGGWVGVKAVLRIAYSNKKFLNSKVPLVGIGPSAHCPTRYKFSPNILFVFLI
jgi:hypothetical protein